MITFCLKTTFCSGANVCHFHVVYFSSDKKYHFYSYNLTIFNLIHVTLTLDDAVGNLPSWGFCQVGLVLLSSSVMDGGSACSGPSLSPGGRGSLLGRMHLYLFFWGGGLSIGGNLIGFCKCILPWQPIRTLLLSLGVSAQILY